MDQKGNFGDTFVYTNPERNVVIFTIFPISITFFTCLDYDYKDLRKIYVQYLRQ